MKKSELLQNYSDNLSNSSGKSHYVNYAKGFLDSLHGEFNKDNINLYIKRLRRQGKSAGTVNFAFRVVRRLFVVNFGAKGWPYRQGEAPAITQRDEYRPALDSKIIKIMIEVAKAGEMGADEAVALALSTTYGLRREEICDLTTEDINLKSNTIFVSTIKGGRQRYHLIADEIRPFIEAHNFNTHYSLLQMSRMFWQIVNKSGLEVLKKERLGWHSIRRPLLTGLIEAGLDPFAAKAFMRWKGGTGDLAMPERYYSNVVIGIEGSKVVTVESKKDAEIFEKYHPFLPFWRDND